MKINIDHIISAIIGAIIASVLGLLSRGLYDRWKNRKSKQFRDLYVELVAAIDALNSIPQVDPYNPDGLELYEEVYREHVSIIVAKLEQLDILLPLAFRANLSMPGHILTSIMRQEFMENIAELSREGKYRKAKKTCTPIL